MIWATLIAFFVLAFLINRSQTGESAPLHGSKDRPEILVDYSFGNPSIVTINTKLKNGAFDEAEEILSSFDSDLFTQVIDHVSLNGKVETLTKWLQEKPNSEFAKLFLGAFYLHEAWLSRGYARGNELSHSQISGFVNCLAEAEKLLSQINASLLCSSEAKARLIRVYMGQSEYEAAIDAFEYCYKNAPNHIWSYIHLTELIQPKWGGSTELVHSYLNRFEKDTIQYKIITLKLILDSYTWEKNVFGGTMEALNQKASESIKNIDIELSSNPVNSIQKFVLYNYLVAISEEVGNLSLTKKYEKLRGNYYTLYPYGIITNNR